MTTLSIGKTFRFNTRAPALLGAIINNAKLLAMLDYDTAKAYENIDLKYRKIYPLLPNGTPDSPESCIYYRFKSESGENIIIADQWIENSTIEIIEHINFQVTFTDCAILDISRVRDAINALGYTNFVIKQL
jgi:hypothetical protein